MLHHTNTCLAAKSGLIQIWAINFRIGVKRYAKKKAEMETMVFNKFIYLTFFIEITPRN